MVRAISIVLAAVILLLVVAWALQRRMIYFPDTAEVPSAARVLPDARDVRLRTDDGLKLGAWHLPPSEEDAVTVLVANGNGGNRALRAPLAAALAERGLGVLLFDYRGYAGNPGSPSEEGLARDVRAARRFLVDEAGVPPQRLLYLGESLGAAVVTELAAEHPPGGLLLRSPFVDLASVGRVHYPFLPVGLLLRDHYRLVDHLRSVRAPTVVVFGTDDSIVPAEQSREVADRAPGLVRAVPVEGADHNDAALLDGRELVDAVVDLAQRVR